MPTLRSLACGLLLALYALAAPTSTPPAMSITTEASVKVGAAIRFQWSGGASPYSLKIFINDNVVASNDGWQAQSVQWRASSDQVPVGAKIKIRVTDKNGETVVSDPTVVGDGKTTNSPPKTPQDGQQSDSSENYNEADPSNDQDQEAPPKESDKAWMSDPQGAATPVQVKPPSTVMNPPEEDGTVQIQTVPNPKPTAVNPAGEVPSETAVSGFDNLTTAESASPQTAQAQVPALESIDPTILTPSASSSDSTATTSSTPSSSSTSTSTSSGSSTDSGNTMTYVVIAVILILLLGGMGAGFWWWKKKQAGQDAAAATKNKKKKKSKKARQVSQNASTDEDEERLVGTNKSRGDSADEYATEDASADEKPGSYSDDEYAQPGTRSQVKKTKKASASASYDY
ncbi:uncharacterized protein JCM15063_003538 [Sporobolomyces koalae]|uniref:uncharacterized protein n=1 Tax=Sporobolomyces koalae TaxID=500713 RepID=UPI00317C408F